MKRIAFLFLLALPLLACHKQNDAQSAIITYPEFNLVYGSTASEQVFAAARGLNGAYILAGTAKSLVGNPGNVDAWVLLLDLQGKMIWQKTFGGSGLDGAYSVAATRDGEYIIAGYTYSNDGDVIGYHGNSDAWVLKIDKNGNKEWQKTFGGLAADHAASIAETSDGGYIMAGQTASTDGDVSINHGNTDAWVVKLDRSGNKLWQKTFGGTGNESVQSVIETSEGDYIMAGYTYSNDGDITGYHPGWGMDIGSSDGWVVKINKDGHLLWSRAFGGSRNDVFNSIIQGKDNSYTVAGHTRSHLSGDVGANHGDIDAWAVSLDKDGKLLWQKPLGGSNGDFTNFITITQDGGYILAGFTSSNDGDVSFNHGGEDAWLVKLDQGGNKQWQRALGGSASDIARAVFQRVNGTYVMVGSTASNDGDLTGLQSNGGPWIITMKDQ